MIRRGSLGHFRTVPRERIAAPARLAEAFQKIVKFADAVAHHCDAALACAADLSDGRLEDALRLMQRNGPILVCGNGGSATDASHIVCELMGRFKVPHRSPIHAVNLAADSAFLTAWANDLGYDGIFARQVVAYPKAACLICISTSGDSPTVIKAAVAALNRAIPVISLTGQGGGRLREYSDVLLAVPERDTAIVQQVHRVIYHWLCAELEARKSSPEHQH